jgi:hypothetical protein
MPTCINLKEQFGRRNGLGHGWDISEVAGYGFVSPAAGVKTSGHDGVTTFAARFYRHPPACLFGFIGNICQLVITARLGATQPHLEPAALPPGALYGQPIG